MAFTVTGSLRNWSAGCGLHWGVDYGRSETGEDRARQTWGWMKTPVPVARPATARVVPYEDNSRCPSREIHLAVTEWQGAIRPANTATRWSELSARVTAPFRCA